MLKVTKRVQRAGGEGAFVVMAKAQELERKGKSMIYMQIGEPDFNTPENIKQAGIRAIEQNYTHYSPTWAAWTSGESLPINQQNARHPGGGRGVLGPCGARTSSTLPA